MDSATKQQGGRQSQLLFTPLMISVVGVIATALALLLYHFIVTRFCLRYRRGAISQSQQQGSQEAAMGGVDDKVLQSIPVLAYRNVVTNNKQQGGLFRRDQNECAVCLGELQEGDMVRLLPTCRHGFHLLCIDNWFLAHSTCPLCRSPVVSVGGDHVLNFANATSTSSASPPIAGIEEDHGIFHHDSDANNNSVVPAAAAAAAAETTRPKSNGLLQHCMSLVLLAERSKPPLLPVQLKRSLSTNT
ncbi:RING-H2 finger protein ATL52-like [Macadamia integrifolia]|uniref:RING-H2 finger protein ATL52-like n=1 Tax=Macadamia integrifolia TaxID=60698 RepID=UPI001C4ED0FD|nr:RING-H2 finger protein ATL52-like [Macadamia integrifolia]